MSLLTTLPVHPATGLRAIGFTSRGPVWPVLGGSQPLGDPAAQQNPQGDPAPNNPAQDQALGEGGTAVVTAVLPDGEVLYTQHTPAAINLDVQDRLPIIEQGEGAQTVTVVRPQQTW
ncbi:hypothetical protein LV457_09520 [Mycobacterium sp. MYCO198283]|uniref:hypothetical protein n=1 Tax=Mycobacterium sp. MYCO198283 TaxID=2883505 RepID=UPI001E3B9DE1|nr:hypothetical protein [Mycobacterium sp. MYCO198283]MCG5432529.1 hypothetical protein [Mycobacterium sp. MYCO198283]